MISVRGYSDGDRVSGLDLVIEPGELVLLAGGPGSGKSRLVASMAGLSKPSSGRIAINGREPGSLEARAGSFFLFQNGNFDPDRDLYRQLIRRLAARGIPKIESSKLIEGWAEEWELGDCLSRRGRDLSLAELQLFGLSYLHMCSFKAVILDEPLQNLGPDLLEKAARLILSVRERGSVLALASLPTPLYKLAGRTVRIEDRA